MLIMSAYPTGRPARGYLDRPDQDRLLRAVLVHGGAGRHRARLAPALGRHHAGGGSILLYWIAAGVIGGTSRFGGRGHMQCALLGALVIASIDDGLGLSSATKFAVTGALLLLAVAVDSIARKGRASA
jgi:ABC-type xylose transport system permease subunit